MNGSPQTRPQEKKMENSELLEFFKEDLFFTELESRTKDEVLAEMVELMAERRAVKDKMLILDMLQRREKLGSTGIGKGVAIPHGRTLVVSDVIVAFGKVEEGIDFDAIDGKPVRLIFLIIAPPQEPSGQYLPVLGKIVELMRVKKFRKKLVQVQSFKQFSDLLCGE